MNTDRFSIDASAESLKREPALPPELCVGEGVYDARDGVLCTLVGVIRGLETGLKTGDGVCNRLVYVDVGVVSFDTALRAGVSDGSKARMKLSLI